MSFLRISRICFLLFFISPHHLFPTVSATKKMKVLVCVTTFPPKQGVAVLNQITGLIDRDCQVDVHTRNAGQREWAHPDVHSYKLFNHIYYNTLPEDLDTYDIIYCQFGTRGNEFVPIKKKLRNKIKLVTCFRGADISRFLKRKPNGYKELFKEGDLFLPVCGLFRDILIAQGCDPKKIIVHHSAVDCNKFTLKKSYRINNKENIRLLTVCRLVGKKALDDAIKAVAQLVPAYPDLQYIIVGEGELYESLNNLIQELHMSNNIELVGKKTQQEVVEYLHASDIFVHPCIVDDTGDMDGIPNAIKEAMACGLPVISTNHPAVMELVTNKKEGILVESNSVEALKDAIEHLIMHPERWQKMGKLGRKKIEAEYEKEKINNRLVTIFNKLLEGNVHDIQ